MKKISTILAVLCAVILLAPSASRAQSIAINSVSATTFCAGDPVSVTFTATGTWQHKNAFTLQLSNDSGGFENGFQNIGSIQDTASGTFTIFSSIPLGNVYRAVINTSMNIYPQDSVIFFDTVFVEKVPGDTTYDTMSMPRRVTVYDTIYDTIFPTHYRVRVMSALPYTVSEDNGTDLLIGQSPGNISFEFTTPSFDTLPRNTVYDGVIGLPMGFMVQGGYGTLYWNFGDGADPATFTQGTYSGQPKTTYSTAGLKMVTVEVVAPSGGCSIWDTTYAYVYDCTSPVIPSNAIVISNDTGLEYWDFALDTIIFNTVNGVDTTTEVVIDPAATHPRSFWINPGVTVEANQDAAFDTIYAEAGATINGGNGNIIYLKKGAVAYGNYNGVLIYEDGASVDPDDAMYLPEMKCSDLTFDYSKAPPNSIMAQFEGVAKANSDFAQIALSPNPTNGIVTVQGVPVSAQVQVMNVLGVAVQQMARTTESNFTIDLSTLAAGTYYVRIVSNNGVTTKKIVKE